MRKEARAGVSLFMFFILLAAAACGGGDDFTFREATGTGASQQELPQPQPLAAEEVFTGIDFDSPLFFTAVPGGDGLLAVVEQAGVIKVFENSGEAAAGILLDISGQVESGGEQGLVGLVFDPGFKENGYFYVNYTTSPTGETRISRFRAEADGGLPVAVPDSEMVMLQQAQPYANHNGGMLAFGPDGYLYIGLGDGGGQGDPGGNAQDLSTILGKVLRVEVSAAGELVIPADNPFADEPGARGEIWAYGLRNPYRFSFDSQTGDLWAGDVGQSSREEIDLIIRGGNYGWNLFEGSQVYRNPEGLPATAFIGPVVDYGRSEGISVIGGYVYRGEAVTGLKGAYLYGDYGSGKVWALVYDGASGAVVSNTEVAMVPTISSFGEDADGEIYVVSLEGGIYRLRDK